MWKFSSKDASVKASIVGLVTIRLALGTFFFWGDCSRAGDGDRNGIAILNQPDGAESGFELIWEARAGRSYHILATSDLRGASWERITSEPVLAQSIVASYFDSESGVGRFYRVLEVDNLGPEVFNGWPLEGSVGNGLREPLSFRLRDASGIDLESLRISINGGDAFGVVSDRVTVAGDMFEILPPNDGSGWGSEREDVGVRVSVADNLGNRTDGFEWHFGLEISPIFVDSTFLVDARPSNGLVRADALKSGLEIVSEEGGRMTFRYSGENSELGPDKVVVMIDAEENVSVKRVVNLVSENKSSFEVTVTVEDDSILNVLEAASIRGQFTDLSNFPDLEITVQELAGVSGLSGRLDARGSIESTAHFGLTIKDKEIKKTFFKVDSRLNSELVDTFTYEKTPFDFDKAKQVWDGPSKTVSVGSIGPIPLVVEIDTNMDAGLSGRAEVAGELKVGFSLASSATLTVEAEGDQMTRSELDFGPLNFNPIGPDWKFDGVLKRQAFVVPQLDLLLGVKGVGGLAGVTFCLRPYLEFEGEFEQALGEKTDHTRYQWALHGGYTSSVKMKIEGLDEVDLPEAELAARRIKLAEDCYPLETESELAILTSKGPPNDDGKVFFRKADALDLEVHGDCTGILSRIQWY